MQCHSWVSHVQDCRNEVHSRWPIVYCYACRRATPASLYMENASMCGPTMARSFSISLFGMEIRGPLRVLRIVHRRSYRRSRMFISSTTSGSVKHSVHSTIPPIERAPSHMIHQARATGER